MDSHINKDTEIVEDVSSRAGDRPTPREQLRAAQESNVPATDGLQLRNEGMEVMEADMIHRLQMTAAGTLAKQPVMLAYLYGSAVEGNLLPSSDVDIALIFDPKYGLSPYDRMQIELMIAAEIERSCGIREADVRSIDNAPLTVRGGVVTEGVLLYSRDEAFRVEYEVHTRKRYFDFLPVVEMMRDFFFRQLQEEGLGHGKTG